MPRTTFDPSFESLTLPAASFVKDATQLINRCTKPTKKEYKEVALVTFAGFLIMGFIGFLVKVSSIPVNNILIGS